jgi:hypothetical protein
MQRPASKRLVEQANVDGVNGPRDQATPPFCSHTNRSSAGKSARRAMAPRPSSAGQPRAHSRGIASVLEHGPARDLVREITGHGVARCDNVESGGP